jgi:DNA invertase Pin-like site-specific DNA recombinase
MGQSMEIKRHPAVRCAIYTRDCPADGDEQRKSRQEQHAACVAFVASQRNRGWRLLRTRQVDHDSGLSAPSPALHRLLDRVRMGGVQVIVVYRLEHLGANLVEFARVIEVLDQHDVSLVAMSQRLNSREAEGRITLNALLTFASFEKKRAAETEAKIGGAMPPKPSLSPKPLGYEKYLDHTKNSNYESRRTIRIPFLVLGTQRKKAFLSWAQKGFGLRKPNPWLVEL